MTGFLTTHVLDTARGAPAAGITIELYRIDGEARTYLHSRRTNGDGRTDTPILGAEEWRPGTYELVFHAGAYFDVHAADHPTPRFLDVVPIRFGMAKEDHYHVPLLLSPYGYSTYRGS